MRKMIVGTVMALEGGVQVAGSLTHVDDLVWKHSPLDDLECVMISVLVMYSGIGRMSLYVDMMPSTVPLPLESNER
jgi:hypothetical protein